MEKRGSLGKVLQALCTDAERAAAQEEKAQPLQPNTGSALPEPWGTDGGSLAKRLRNENPTFSELALPLWRVSYPSLPGSLHGREDILVTGLRPLW